MSLSINNAISKSIYNTIYREIYSFKRYTDQLATGYGILISREFSVEEPTEQIYYRLGDIEAERLAKEHQKESARADINYCSHDTKTQ